MADKVLITDYVHPVLHDKLTGIGLEVEYSPEISIEELHERIGEFEGLVFNSRVHVKEALLSNAKKLKFIGRLGSGMEIVDQDLAKEMNIAVFSAPDGNCNAVAEHAMGMLLSLLNKLRSADVNVRNFEWEREAHRGIEIEGKTVGVIAFGHTGKAMAKKLIGFDCEILVYDKYLSGYEVDHAHVTETSLERVQAESDIISLHLPLNPETKHMVDAEFIDKCKDGVLLINTSRGNVIKTEDLIHALRTGKVSGAGLDVIENEKPHLYTDKEKEMYRSLHEFPQVILSPHVAGWTKESLYKIADIIATKVVHLYSQDS